MENNEENNRDYAGISEKTRDILQKSKYSIDCSLIECTIFDCTKRYFTEMRKEVRGLKSVPWHRSG